MKLKTFIRTAIITLTCGLGGPLLNPAYGQAAGGGGSGSGGLRQMISANPGCEEGRRSIFYEKVNHSDENQMVIKTCRGGSYMTDAERAAYIYHPNYKCSPEGSTTSWENSEAGQMVRRPYICDRGKWVPF